MASTAIPDLLEAVVIPGTALVVPWGLVAAGVAAGLLTNALGALLPALSTVREQPLRALRSR